MQGKSYRTNTTDYRDAFSRNVDYFDSLYRKGLTSAPLDVNDLQNTDCAVDKAVSDLSSTLYETFSKLGRVIAQYGE